MGFPFSDYIGLIDQFLAGRTAIVDELERQLFGARGKVSAANGDRESIAGIFETCFFESPAIARDLSRLNRQLDAAHLADGFEPARQDGYARGLDPVELVLRACHDWDRDRWPGKSGRITYADSLFAVFVLNQLERLSLRIWDDEDGNRDQEAQPLLRLQQIQGLLDRLNGRPHGIQLARDARWLIQTAQGPLTRHVRPYIVKADHVSRSFSGADGVEIHRAGAVLAGGHLRSQLQHLSWHTGWDFDDPRLLALTRTSNSMDMALLVRDLVPLLDAYDTACARGDSDARIALADAILQGLSADPELLLTRLDLLGPSTMLEDLFVERGNGTARYTQMGDAHCECLARYGELVARTAPSLEDDCRRFDPAHAPYSPFGVVYGFCADLFANLVLTTSRPSATSAPRSVRLQPDHELSIEDIFDTRERLEEKRALAQEWERLPKGERERAPFAHSPDWASRMHGRLTRALEARVTRPADAKASALREARIYVVPRGIAIDALPDGTLPAEIVQAQEHCLTSDATRARLTGATVLPADRMAADRAEGRMLACVQSDSAWFGVSKVPLTLYTGQGKDALITDVPPAIVDVLLVLYPRIFAAIPRT